MPLDPIAKAIIDQMSAMNAIPLSQMSAAAYRAMNNAVPRPPSMIQLAEITDRTIPGPDGDVPVRIYKASQEPNQPCLVFFHGGGFVICGLDSHDGTCRALSKATGCTVVSVDYRLAPEHKFPAGVEDSYAATLWVAKNASALGIDANRIAVGGDSAGANFATVVALLIRERGGPKLRHQMLIYPVTDQTCSTESYDLFARDYFLTKEMMIWFRDHYLPTGHDPADPLASPLHMENLADLPPATVITAEYDPLRDEGEAYAARLKKAGVAVDMKRYDGVFHGFFSMGGVLPQADQALAFATERLRQAFKI
ncbi:MAG: alpha/beta hydrolase [Rhodospirillaceae bacterium]|nr:alpha/beta hydrolase [Rhodospirillaceae bacterium]